jgi:UDP-N-acetylmuramoyl-tripeptide--D-alanyl-D-alanine ligase
MPQFAPEILARWTGGSWSVLPAAPLRGFATDSRQLKTGQVFVALSTEKRDGHDFLSAAETAGASAAIVSRLVPGVALPQLLVPDPLRAFQQIALENRRRFTGPVIGISGSCGKTSTKDLLSLLLGGEKGGVLSTEGNLNNHIGVPHTLTRIDPSRHHFAVVEAGISAPGEMALLAGLIEPDIALITLVAPAHLAELGGIDGVAGEKARLPASLRAAGVAIFPRQCAEFTAFRTLDVRKMIIEPAEVIRPSEPPKDTVYFTVTQRGDITALAIAYGKPPPLQFTIRRASPGMAQNVVLAVCTALWLNVSPSEIQERLDSWRPAHWRGEIVHEGGRTFYLDCYNANPASMRDALENFCGMEEALAPRLFILGCMEELGPDAARFHQELGRSLQLRQQDTACVIGSEARALRHGLLDAGAREAQVELLTDLRRAAELVEKWQGAIFVKGSRKYRLETVLPGALSAAAH